MHVSVIGGATVDNDTFETAREVGQLLGRNDHTVVCGGLTGVMEAVSKGATETGGTAIGILPSADRGTANRFVDTAIATGLGQARNVLVVLNGDATIAINGGAGTLSEIAHAVKAGRPVAGINTHSVRGVEPVGTPERALEYVESNATP